MAKILTKLEAERSVQAFWSISFFTSFSDTIYDFLPNFRSLYKVSMILDSKLRFQSAITGLVMPKKKKLAQPDILPERSVTTPASSYQPVQETWEDIPYAKKLTVKQRRELQKKMEEARELQQEETMREIQEQMMVEPDEDLEMQAILMNDIASSSGVSSAESSRNVSFLWIVG